jgi:Tfp pilus assembly protein PilZ
MSRDDAHNRRFERVDLRARVQLTSLDPERDPATGVPTTWDTDDLCETLSVGGAFVRTDDPPAKGRRVLLQIHLPSGESIETEGRVAWTRVPLRAGTKDPGVGIEFVAPTGDARKTLERFVTRVRSVASE